MNECAVDSSKSILFGLTNENCEATEVMRNARTYNRWTADAAPCVRLWKRLYRIKMEGGSGLEELDFSYLINQLSFFHRKKSSKVFDPLRAENDK